MQSKDVKFIFSAIDIILGGNKLGFNHLCEIALPWWPLSSLYLLRVIKVDDNNALS